MLHQASYKEPHILYPITPQNHKHYSHSTDKETEASKNEAVCQRSLQRAHPLGAQPMTTHGRGPPLRGAPTWLPHPGVRQCISFQPVLSFLSSAVADLHPASFTGLSSNTSPARLTVSWHLLLRGPKQMYPKSDRTGIRTEVCLSPTTVLSFLARDELIDKSGC